MRLKLFAKDALIILIHLKIKTPRAILFRFIFSLPDYCQLGKFSRTSFARGQYLLDNISYSTYGERSAAVDCMIKHRSLVLLSKSITATPQPLQNDWVGCVGRFPKP